MTSTTATLTSPLKYGALELKEIIARNTKKAFVYTISLLLLLALFSFTYRLIYDLIFPPPNVVKVKGIRVSIVDLPPPQLVDQPPPPPPPTTMPLAAGGPASRAGIPVPVPDAMLAPDAKDFASVDEIARASAEGGSGEDMGGFADGLGVDPNANIQIATREEDPGIDDFVYAEEQPKFDFAELQSRVKYPDIARERSIQGKVVVRVLIDKDGSIAKYVVVESAHKLLEPEAVKAVLATTFTPAKQNGQPTKIWISIPVNFRIR